MGNSSLAAQVINWSSVEQGKDTMNEDTPFHDDRREADSDRRQEQTAVPQEHRTEGERRKLVYGVQFTTGGSLLSIENWLDENCQGEWAAVLFDMDDDLIRKTINIMFELAEDRERFKASAGQF